MLKTILYKISYIVLGIIIGYFGYPLVTAKVTELKEVRSGNFKFISPLIECESGKELGSDIFSMLKGDLITHVDAAKKNDPSLRVSLYFRDLQNGPWFGIEEDANYSPASLLKVPIMMAYLKISESEREILDEELTYNGEYEYDNNIDSAEETIKPGVTYKIEELIKKMVVNSDNRSKDLLKYNLEKEYPEVLAKIYAGLGLEKEYKNMSNNDFVSVKDYASIFRILYNASLLNQDTSERALSILSEVKYDYGIVKGLPKGIASARKFGYRSANVLNESQFHDCGIIYRPDRPYLLCVMTKSRNPESLPEMIEDISKIVYDSQN